MRKSGLLVLLLFIGLAPLQAEQKELVAVMETIDEAYKGLRRAEGVEGVKLAREAQVNTLKALAFVPEMAGKMPEGTAKDLALADYRRLLGLLYVKFVEMERAHLEGKADAVETIRNELKELRKEGHNNHIED
jgi:hypothetical protein